MVNKIADDWIWTSDLSLVLELNALPSALSFFGITLEIFDCGWLKHFTNNNHV